ncbi:hypothetical protein PROFUN_12418 [Planoprotostelium fungivorum]|uniref:Uncharacterized protein n=1 Tax=Planoprotostelium fungivorum TaxID=1890364 RepID=A0A2P6N5Q4_9EUKA|nr:hypothetical protein PROFUN_12418 [Planoprotostelium fungivorum]
MLYRSDDSTSTEGLDLRRRRDHLKREAHLKRERWHITSDSLLTPPTETLATESVSSQRLLLPVQSITHFNDGMGYHTGFRLEEHHRTQGGHIRRILIQVDMKLPSEHSPQDVELLVNTCTNSSHRQQIAWNTFKAKDHSIVRGSTSATRLIYSVTVGIASGIQNRKFIIERRVTIEAYTLRFDPNWQCERRLKNK